MSATSMPFFIIVLMGAPGVSSISLTHILSENELPNSRTDIILANLTY